VHFPESRKPVPIVPKRLIRGVSERVDCFGEVVVALNEVQARTAIGALLEEGAEAIAICLLWSFRNPIHEERIAQLVRSLAPECFVSTSVELAPKWGEYERLTATALNAYIGPVTARYLGELDTQLRSAGYRKPLQITQCGGGSISLERAMRAPLLTLDSGPVSGVTASRFLGELLGERNIITSDMGGTSFDVGIITKGEAAFSFVSHVAQYEYFIPKVDIQAIGSGGGSLARVDPASKTLKVGPESAGADPGPACYGKGNPVATVTDADVVLGFIDPDNFLGGRIRLDKAKAIAAVQAVADGLGLNLHAAAAGIVKIAEFRMADLIRKTTVEKGFDPRDYSLFAFGGAGPVHAGVFARELGVRNVIIPLNRIASTWCAFGAATADILHIHEAVDILTSPFDPLRVAGSLHALLDRAARKMELEAIAARRRRYRCSIDMRHRGQIHEVEVAWPEACTRSNGMPSNANGTQAIEALTAAFYSRYEAIYGKGAAYRDARLEIVNFRVRAMADTRRPRLAQVTPETALRTPPPTAVHFREVYWDGKGGLMPTPIYNGAMLRPGHVIEGPAVVETTDTTVVVRHGQLLQVDTWGNLALHFGHVGSGHGSLAAMPAPA
jgi:N-methylhydantoinase A